MNYAAEREDRRGTAGQRGTKGSHHQYSWGIGYPLANSDQASAAPEKVGLAAVWNHPSRLWHFARLLPLSPARVSPLSNYSPPKSNSHWTRRARFGKGLFAPEMP